MEIPQFFMVKITKRQPLLGPNHLSRARRDHLPRPKGPTEAPEAKVVPVLFFSGEEVGKLGVLNSENIGFRWEIYGKYHSIND